MNENERERQVVLSRFQAIHYLYRQASALERGIHGQLLAIVQEVVDTLLAGVTLHGPYATTVLHMARHHLVASLTGTDAEETFRHQLDLDETRYPDRDGLLLDLHLIETAVQDVARVSIITTDPCETCVRFFNKYCVVVGTL